jgi:hypothetical protein
MTDRTAAALASALPAGIIYDTGAMGFTGERHPAWDAARIARFQANILAESGWRLVHDDDRPQNVPNRYWDGVDAAAEIVEHYDTPSQAVAALRVLSRVGREAAPPQTFAEHTAEALALIHDHVEAGDE